MSQKIILTKKITLEEKKDLKIEKDQKIFHLKGLKKKEDTRQLLNNLTNSLILTFWILFQKS